jgi:hypothetical protein
LGALLTAPDAIAACQARFRDHKVFYERRHQAIYDACEVKAKNGGIDPTSVYCHLRDTNRGDYGNPEFLSYLSELPDKIKGTINVQEWVEIVWQKYELRRTVRTCQEIIDRTYECTDIDDYWLATKSKLAELLDTGDSSEQVWTVRQLNDFDHHKDPNAVIGMRDGRTTRYLCRGYGAWLIGPSGVGKSSFIHQCGFSWALKRPFMGITPVRALRVLIIQAENDEGDAAEMTQGILRSLGITEMDNELEVLDQNVKVVSERRTVGQSFCTWLEKQINRHLADIVFVDPFLSFAGFDVSRLDQCSKFLRQQLNPVLVSTGAILFASHHTGKPKFEKGVRNPTAIEYAYAGIGSSELVNWARAVMVLLQLGDGQHYELKLAKRGPRAGATHPSGEFTSSVFLRHAKDRIFWEQVEAPEEPAEEEVKERKQGGKPNRGQEIASSNLHGFLSACTVDGEGLNAIAKRLEVWLASQKQDASRNTCKRIIPLLIQNGKLIKTPDLVYIKGPNA